MASVKKIVSVIRHITKSAYPYSRLRLITDYSILLFRSICFHKIRPSAVYKNQLHDLSFLGFKIYFNSYPQLIDLIEEIFVFQEYKTIISNPKPLIIDAGSNIGLSILYFKKLFPTSRIIAFEPETVAFDLLGKNVYMNGITDVELHNCALSNKRGELILYFDKAHSDFLSIGKANEQIVVRAEMLSAVLSQKADFIKIDVEGSEIGIIDDLIETEKIKEIDQMIIEYHPHITNVSVSDFISKIEGSGFKCSSKQSSFRPHAKSWLINCVRI